MFYALAGMYAASRAAEAAADVAKTAARSGAARLEANVRTLEHHVDRLLMISEALWNILKEQHGYTDENLIERVRQIDLQDGRLDGKVAPTGPQTCPSCKRPISARHAKCIYCGRALDTLFDT